MLKTYKIINVLKNGQTSLIAQLQRPQTTTAATFKGNVETNEFAKAKPFTDVPRENYFGLIRKMLPGGTYHSMELSKLMVHLKEVHGDIFILPAIFGRQEMLVTHKPEDFEQVFRNEGIWPERPGSNTLKYHREKHRANFFQGVEGLISTQGKTWGKFRSAVNPVLMQPKNVRLYYQKMSDVNKDFIERIKEIRDPKTLEMPDDFKNEINRWTFESVAVVALDKHIGLIREKRDNPNVKVLFESLNDFFELQGDLEFKVSLWRYIATPKFKKLMKAFDNIQISTLGFVNEAIERLEQETKNGIERPENEQSVLEKLLKLDKKIAIVMAMDMLMAGVDTTTSVFTAAMLCLAKNPEKQEKLREEIMSILPEKNSEFTEASMKNLPYLRACLKETHRIYPLIFANVRLVQQDTVLSGYRIPKATYCVMVPLTSLADEKYFARANEFLPERWLRSDKQSESCMLKATNPFVFTPFGFGPRMCIGKRIVDMELELGIARLLRNFRVEFNYSTENAFKNITINVPNIPLKFKFIDLEK